ncbi:MAG: RNA polymerase factor sigma-54 [Neisseriaceae bacterium]|nr:RNA polymerase factor sigma-54 [Neisseriaceae bacterium]
MELKKNLTQTQSLKLMAQLQQSMTILQLSSAELDSLIDDEIQRNPLLEKVDTSSDENFSLDLNRNTHARQFRDDPTDDAVAGIIDEPDFYQNLHNQVCECCKSERQADLLHILIESLDNKGYLKYSIDNIIEEYPLHWRLEKKELEEALDLLQQFDPPGIGARNLAESLLLQLKRHYLPQEIAYCATEIIKNHLHLLQRVNVETSLQKAVKFSPSTIAKSLDVIKTLEPYPCSDLGDTNDTIYVRPDVRVYKKDGEWVVQSEPHLRPHVVINTNYEQAVSLDTNAIWKQKLLDAKTFLHNLQWRENTILRVARFIVNKQQDFFEFGNSALVPLKLSDIADELEISISTISRSTTQKYMICPQGLFELKFFFSTNVGSNEENEDGMSNKAVKEHIAEWIAGESRDKPLSDDDLKDKLATVGIKIARRTIAKYREALGIPSIHHRRKNYESSK